MITMMFYWVSIQPDLLHVSEMTGSDGVRRVARLFIFHRKALVHLLTPIFKGIARVP